MTPCRNKCWNVWESISPNDFPLENITSIVILIKEEFSTFVFVFPMSNSFVITLTPLLLMLAMVCKRGKASYQWIIQAP